MAVTTSYEFLTSGGVKALTGSEAKAGSQIASTLFIGYKSDGSPIPTVFADDIAWKIKSADGTTEYRSTKINDTTINTTEDLIEYISKLPTTATVETGIRATDAMVYKGTLSGGATVANTTYTPAAVVGDTYKVATSGYINGIYCEVGDMLICLNDTAAAAATAVSSDTESAVRVTAATANGKWSFIQTNLTLTKLKIFNNNDSDAVLEYDTVAEKSITFVNGINAVIDGTTLKVGHTNSVDEVATLSLRKITYDIYGHITGSDAWTPASLSIQSAGGAITDALEYNPDDKATTLNFSDGLSVTYNNSIYTITNSGLRSVTDGTSGDGKIKFNIGGTDTEYTIYTLPVLSTSTIGGARVFKQDTTNAWTKNTTATSSSTTHTINEATTTSDRYYAIEADKNGSLFVNVPWTDTDTTVSAEFASIATTAKLKIASFGPTGSQDDVYVPYATASQYGVVKVGSTLTSTDGYEATGIKDGVIYAKNTNTWRPIWAYSISDDAKTSSGSQVITSSITGTALLAFGSEFVYTEKDSGNLTTESEIHIAWAEVAADGTITYSV